ncbi:MAG: hydrogenase maturation protease [bacterium]
MRILLCGMGNRDRGDDGFGSYIVDNIQESDNLRKVDCTIYPENYLNKMVDESPDLIIFLDAVKREGSQAILLRNREVLENNPISISTHNLPFSAIYEYLKANTQAKIWFLGIPPISFEKMSETTKKVAHKIINALHFLDKQEKLNIIKIYETLSTTLK